MECLGGRGRIRNTKANCISFKDGKNAQPQVFLLREERYTLSPVLPNMRQHLFVELSEKALQALVLVATQSFAFISDQYTPQ